jgi:hypothetical protein
MQRIEIVPMMNGTQIFITHSAFASTSIYLHLHEHFINFLNYILLQELTGRLPVATSSHHHHTETTSSQWRQGVLSKWWQWS